MVIKLVRHGESLQNVGQVNSTEFGDSKVPLSEAGWQQSRETGRLIGPQYLANALIYVSPYARTRQTLMGILEGSGIATSDHSRSLKIYEDIRLREVEFGFNKAKSEIQIEQGLRTTHGYMFYRYQGGESPADCYDRICSFLESLMRQVDRKKQNKVLIVSHGITIRCFVTRFLHLSIETFCAMKGPLNCEAVTIAPAHQIENPVLSNKKWAVTGLSLRKEGESG